MKSLFMKHKILLSIIIILLIAFGAVGGIVVTKLNKIDYHDGTIAQEIVDNELDNASEEAHVKVSDSIESEDVIEEKESIILESEVASLEEKEVVFSNEERVFDEDVFNILLLGTDERTTKFNTNARADSIMILSLNKRDNTMKLVSLQRGMGFPVLEGQYAGQYDWLTHLFRYGGADLMLKSIREVLNVDIDYYVRVNFSTFEQLVDSVGGVDVELTEEEAIGINNAMKKRENGKIVQKGSNHLDGYEALQYSRLRSPDSDWKRVQRQRNVIQSVVSSAKDMNLLELNNMLDEVLPLVQTNLKTTDILGMISYAPAVLGQDFDQMTIPASGTYGSMKGMGGRTLYAVDFQKNSEILHEFLYGKEE